MTKDKNNLAGRITLKLTVWLLIIVAVVSCFYFCFTAKIIKDFYADNYHNKILITYEYTRRVLSDVYVTVTNNIYYLEHTLDNPDSQKDVMERIVRNGTRVHSCGINFIEDYYPQKGHKFCPFAWRNPSNREEILSDEKHDANFNYFDADWFLSVIHTDSAKWSEPFHDGYDDETALAAYMVPIHDKTGRPVAVLGADISLDWLTSKLAETDSTYNANSSFAPNLLGLETQSFIINHDGMFITNHEKSNLIVRNFFSQVKPCGDTTMEELIEKMKSGKMSEKECEESYLINGQECYLFYTPIKYTEWILVTAVPCQSIDLLATLYGVSIILLIIIVMLIIILLNHYYITRMSSRT